MTQVLKFNKFQEFLDFNSEQILGNYFTYYHIISVVSALNAGKMDLYEAYNITDDQEHMVICLKVTGSFFIYSDKWNDEIVDTLVREVSVEKYKNFSFLGQRNLILELFEKAGREYEIKKDRLVYTCDKVLTKLRPYAGVARNATVNDFHELVQMSLDNHIEEYEGKGSKKIADMQGAVAHGIETGRLYLLSTNHEICSILQIINEKPERPMIGNLYTKPAFRNRGHAYTLLHIVTEGLLNNGAEQCGLVSDVANPSSNKVFVNIGYTAIYQWIWVDIND
jgi:predicted GNAT family acetyltransferase